MKKKYNPVFDSINEDSLSVRKKGEDADQTLLYSICLLQWNSHTCSCLDGVYMCCITVI